MKQYVFTFWTIALTLSVIPAILGVFAPEVITTHYNELITSYSSLMGISFFVTWFLNVESYFLKTIKPIHEETKSQYTYYNIVPWLAIVYIIDLLLIAIALPDFTNKHFGEFTKIIGSIIFTIIMYAIFKNPYNPIQKKIQ